MGGVLGVGVDIVSIARMRRAIEDGGDAFMGKVFTLDERRAAAKSADPVSYLATVFAAKEATFKTLDIDWETGVQLSEVEVRHAASGQPRVTLRGTFAEYAEKRGGAQVLVSLSYERDYAVACAVLLSH